MTSERHPRYSLHNGAKRILAFRSVTLAPQRGQTVVFELGEQRIRSYEVQILVVGAENNVLLSVWKTTFSAGGTIFAPEKRVLHSELISREVPFVPVIPFPPVIGVREAQAGAGAPGPSRDDDLSDASGDDDSSGAE